MILTYPCLCPPTWKLCFKINYLVANELQCRGSVGGVGFPVLEHGAEICRFVLGTLTKNVSPFAPRKGGASSWLLWNHWGGEWFHFSPSEKILAGLNYTMMLSTSSENERSCLVSMEEMGSSIWNHTSFGKIWVNQNNTKLGSFKTKATSTKQKRGRGHTTIGKGTTNGMKLSQGSAKW